MRGRDGQPRVGSLDLILRWMSRTLLTELRFLELSCLRIEDPARDLTLGENHQVKIWHSLSTKSDHAAWGKFQATHELERERRLLEAMQETLGGCTGYSWDDAPLFLSCSRNVSVLFSNLEMICDMNQIK